MKKNLLRLLSCTLLAGSMALAGCTDDNYDLGDLDLNVGLGTDDPAGLRLPSDNSTREIALSNLLDIDESDVITTDADGNYVFAKGASDSDVTPAHPLIDPIIVTQAMSPDDYTLSVNDLNNVMDAVMATLPSGLSRDVVTQLVTAAIETGDVLPNIIGMPKQRISFFRYQTDLPEEVLELQSVEASTENGRSAVSFHLSFSPHFAQIVTTIDQLVLTLPTFLEREVSVNNVNVSEATNQYRGNIVLTNVPTYGADVVVRLKSLTDVATRTAYQDVPELGDALIIQPRQYEADKQEVILQGDVQLDMSFSKSHIDRTALVQQVVDHYMSGTQYDYTINNQTTISDIEITSGTGRFSPSIDLADGIGEVEITSLPDFLDDPDVTLNVANPHIGLSVSSDIDVPGILRDLRIVALDEQGAQLAAVSLPDIKVHGNQTTRILIHDPGTTPVFSDEHPNVYGAYNPSLDNQEGSSYITPVSGRLADLLTRIPKRLKFEVTAATDETQLAHVELGHEYTIQPSYDFWAPLAFNEGSIIIYRDTVDGWHDDLEDLKLTAGAYVELTADVTNRMPVDLTLNADALGLNADGTHSKLAAGKVQVTVSTPDNGKGNVIEAGSKTSPKVTRIVIRIAQQQPDGLTYLDGVAYRAVAITPGGPEYQGQALNKKVEEQNLKIDNISPTLHGRIIYNLDSDD